MQLMIFRMNHSISFKALVALVLLLPSSMSIACGFVSGIFTGESVPLSYVGNVSFQKPVTENNVTRISMAFSGGKWLENSGRALKGVKAIRDDHEIRFTVETCLAGGEDPKPEIRLKGLSSGKYQLIYQNPNSTNVWLGELVIN